MPSTGKYYSYCKSCHSEYQRARNRRTPLTGLQKIGQRSNQLFREFGLTVVQYLGFGDMQYWQCKICDSSLAPFDKETQVDHCHTTGMVRGILCARCNRALGMMDDDPKRLRQAANYVEALCTKH